jgi:hypothetical protein
MRTSLIIIIGMLMLGCGRDKSPAVRQAIRNQHQELIHQYLQGDVSQARDSLLQAIKIMKSDTALTPMGRANFLTIDYFRLYTLEKMAGAQTAADDYWSIGREWQGKAMELAGVPPEQITEKVRSYGSDRVMREVDGMDRTENNGDLPKYRQQK